MDFYKGFTILMFVVAVASAIYTRRGVNTAEEANKVAEEANKVAKGANEIAEKTNERAFLKERLKMFNTCREFRGFIVRDGVYFPENELWKFYYQVIDTMESCYPEPACKATKKFFEEANEIDKWRGTLKLKEKESKEGTIDRQEYTKLALDLEKKMVICRDETSMSAIDEMKKAMKTY